VSLSLVQDRRRFLAFLVRGYCDPPSLWCSALAISAGPEFGPVDEPSLMRLIPQSLASVLSDISQVYHHRVPTLISVSRLLVCWQDALAHQTVFRPHRVVSHDECYRRLRYRFATERVGAVRNLGQSLLIPGLQAKPSSPPALRDPPAIRLRSAPEAPTRLQEHHSIRPLPSPCLYSSSF